METMAALGRARFCCSEAYLLVVACYLEVLLLWLLRNSLLGGPMRLRQKRGGLDSKGIAAEGATAKGTAAKGAATRGPAATDAAAKGADVKGYCKGRCYGMRLMQR